MCFPITCATCGLTTWGGDGRHIDTVMRSVPEGDACRCPHARRKGRLQTSCVLEQLCAPMQMAQPHATSAGAVCAGSLNEQTMPDDGVFPLGAGGNSVRDCGLARLRESLRLSLREAAPAAVGAGGAPERNSLAPGGGRGGQLLVGLAGLRSALSHSSINRPTSLPARSFGGSIGDAVPPALGSRGRAAGPLSAELPPRSAGPPAAAALAATQQQQQQHLAAHQGSVVRMRASLSTGNSAEAMSMVLGQGTCDAQVKIVGKASKQASICTQQC